MRISLMASFALLFSAPVFAQNFNIDIGSNVTFPLPTNALGAAAAQPGTWDAVPGAPGTTAALADIAGTVTGVSLVGVGGGALEFNNALTMGDDKNLMDDGNDPGQTPGTWTFNGLAPGNYVVYTYAWAPDSAAYISKVAVATSPDPQQTVGGAWPSGYVLGVTHSLHHVSVASGGSIVVTITVGIGFATLDGFQLVYLGAGAVSFCDPGVSGVSACPCANPPSGSGRGCDNSSLTGGATVTDARSLGTAPNR